MTGHEVLNRWRHIRRWLQVDLEGVEGDFCGWAWRTAEWLSPSERAAGYEEWADFYEWRLEQRAAELASDRRSRHLMEEWTDSMAYCCRRSAAWVRGEDPGEWVSQRDRRPDLHAEGQAIVAEIVAELDARRVPAGRLATAG